MPDLSLLHATPSANPDPDAAADVLIVGGGPAGLALACALADAGLAATVIEQQGAEAMAAPAPDGRDIALTHRARAILQRLGLWQRLPADEVAPICRAQVHNGDPLAGRPAQAGLLGFDAVDSGHEALGFLVPNHLLRRAAFDGASARSSVRLVCGASVTSVQLGTTTGRLRLADGRKFVAPLVVAADSRFSTTRRAMGIAARSLDFGRNVIVARMQHALPHDATAHECFGWRRTLALLPMNGQQVSAVITVRSSEAPALLSMPEAEFEELVMAAAGRRLGTMRLAGPRHAYPLVAVLAECFAVPRGALIGDAAVGMHPVTAHGYNFGLYGVEVLAHHLQQAARAGSDLGSLATLGAFARAHRRAVTPIYHGTNALVRLYTDDRAPARLLREAVLRMADRLPALKAAISHQLTALPGTASPNPPAQTMSRAWTRLAAGPQRAR